MQILVFGTSLKKSQKVGHGTALIPLNFENDHRLDTNTHYSINTVNYLKISSIHQGINIFNHEI